jgi:hypothetical protein
MINECMSIWGEKPKPKGYVAIDERRGYMTEEQMEFKYKKTREEEMKEISADATRQLKAILDEIIAKGNYSISDFTNIINTAVWIERN